MVAVERKSRVIELVEKSNELVECMPMKMFGATDFAMFFHKMKKLTKFLKLL